MVRNRLCLRGSRPLTGGLLAIGWMLWGGLALAQENPHTQDLQQQLEAMEQRLALLEGKGEKPAEAAELFFYGSLRVGAGPLDDGAGAGFNVFDRSSRLGVRGTLGHPGGLRPQVIWQVESQFRSEAGSGELASRDTFVGLSNRWGTLRAGFFDSPGKTVGRRVDLIQSRVGDNRNLLRTDNLQGGQGGRSPGWDNRFGNAIEYATPVWAGMEAAVQYSANFEQGFGQDTTASPAISARLSYTRGPLWLGMAAETIDRDSDRVTGTDRNPELYRVAGSYQWGDLTLNGLFQRARYQQGNSDWNRNTLGVGAGYAITPRTRLTGQVYQARAMDALEDSGATMAAAEIEHRLYPQTRIYLTVAHTRNDDQARFQSTRGLLRDGPVGSDSTSASLLLRHDFVL